MGYRANVCAIVVAVAAASLAAQSPERPSFDAASIKPSGAASGGRSIGAVGDRVVGTNVALRQIVQYAYRRADGGPFLVSQIMGAPRWAETDPFDVQAKAGGAVTDRRLRLMAQTLLEDRFQLRVHREMRELAVYDLVPGKGAIRMKRSADQTPPETDGGSPVMDPGTLPRGRYRMIAKPSPSGSVTLALAGSAITMPTFLGILQQYLDRPLIDSTGAAGLYDVQLEFGLGQPQSVAPDDAGASIFTAIQDQLGLKLDAVRRPVEVLVVDRVERPTAD